MRTACPHANVDHEHNREGHHTCRDCHGDVTCKDVGPDVCEYEAVKAERTDEICTWLRARANKKRLQGQSAQAKALFTAAIDIEAGAEP